MIKREWKDEDLKEVKKLQGILCSRTKCVAHVCVHMCAIPLSKACQAAMLSQGKEPVSTGR